MKYIIALLIIVFLHSCAEYERVHVETEVIETKAPFNLTNQTPEQAIRSRHFRGRIVELEVIKSTPIGVSDNWFSGSKVFYEVEYKIVIHHYDIVKVEN
jgi:hypothetical protein